MNIWIYVCMYYIKGNYLFFYVLLKSKVLFKSRVIDCILLFNLQLTFCTQGIISNVDTLMPVSAVLCHPWSDDSSWGPPAPSPLVGHLNPTRGSSRLPTRGARRLKYMCGSWLPLGPSWPGTWGALVLSTPRIWIRS